MSLGKKPLLPVPTAPYMPFCNVCDTITPCSTHRMQLSEVHVFGHNSNLPENSEEKKFCCHSQLLQFRINQSTSDSRTKKKSRQTCTMRKRCISCPQQGADNTVTRDTHTITQRVKKCAASYQHFFPKLAQIFTRNARIARSHRASNNGTVTLRYAASDLAPHASWPHNAWLSSC